MRRKKEEEQDFHLLLGGETGERKGERARIVVEREKIRGSKKRSRYNYTTRKEDES
jgi:hypothetical protein